MAGGGRKVAYWTPGDTEKDARRQGRAAAKVVKRVPKAECCKNCRRPFIYWRDHWHCTAVSCPLFVCTAKLRPRKTTRERARDFVAAFRASAFDTAGLEAMAELFLNREAGRAYDVMVRQMEQVIARGSVCPVCKRRKPRPDPRKAATPEVP